MLKKFNQKKKQKGYSILVIALSIIVIISVFSAWLVSGQSNNNTINNLADIQAATVISDSANIKLAFDTIVSKNVNPQNATFVPYSSTPDINNILDVANGAKYPNVNNAVLRNGLSVPEGIWVYNNTGFKGNGLGTVASEQVILLAGITNIVCQRINLILNQTASIVIPQSNSQSAVLGATLNNPNSSVSIDLSGSSYNTISGWQSGCLSTQIAIDNNVFFKVLKVN